MFDIIFPPKAVILSFYWRKQKPRVRAAILATKIHKDRRQMTEDDPLNKKLLLGVPDASRGMFHVFSKRVPLCFTELKAQNIKGKE
jgi:hypothetical protein